DDVSYYNYGNFGQLGLSIPRLVGMVSTGSWVSLTSYHQVKHVNQEQNVNFHNGYTPCLILRLGEALLNYAEARAELGTITQEDLVMSINKLRDRVGMIHMDLDNLPQDPKYADVGVSPLIVEIRRERRIELFGEGFRFDDLRRWRQGDKLNQKDYGIRWEVENRQKIDPSNAVQLGFRSEEHTSELQSR